MPRRVHGREVALNMGTSVSDEPDRGSVLLSVIPLLAENSIEGARKRFMRKTMCRLCAISACTRSSRAARDLFRSRPRFFRGNERRPTSRPSWGEADAGRSRGDPDLQSGAERWARRDRGHGGGAPSSQRWRLAVAVPAEPRRGHLMETRPAPALKESVPTAEEVGEAAGGTTSSPRILPSPPGRPLRLRASSRSSTKPALRRRSASTSISPSARRSATTAITSRSPAWRARRSPTTWRVSWRS